MRGPRIRHRRRGRQHLPRRDGAVRDAQLEPRHRSVLRQLRGRLHVLGSEDQGFSLTHLSGAGCSGYQDFPFIPTTEAIDEAPSRLESSDLDPDLLADFDHGDERASPGRYSVALNPANPDRRIGVDLAADTRSGVGRFDFPGGQPSNMLINAAGNGMANPLTNVRIRPRSNEVSGVSETGSFCWGRPYFKIFMVARFDHGFDDYGTWTDQTLAPGSTSARDSAVDPFNLKPLEGLPEPSTYSTTAQAGAYLGFGSGKRVTARVGIRSRAGPMPARRSRPRSATTRSPHSGGRRRGAGTARSGESTSPAATAGTRAPSTRPCTTPCSSRGRSATSTAATR